MSKRHTNRREGIVEYDAADGTTVYAMRFRDATGRRVQEKIGSSAQGWTRAKAAALCADRRVDVRRDGWRHAATGPTLRQYIERFLDVHPTIRGLKETSVEHYRVSLSRLLPALGDRTLAELEQRPELIERWLAAELHAGRAPKTVANTITALGTLCKRAQRERLIRANPVDLIDRPRIEQKPNEPLDEAEIAALLAALSELAAETEDEQAQERFQLARRMTLLALSTGFRRGELFALRWGDLDLLAGTVRVERALVRSKITTPKTRHSRRTVELGPAARTAIEEQYRASSFTDEDDYVFGHPRLGTPLDTARFGREIMRPALKRARIREDFRPWHDQRVTSLTFSAAVNPAYVVMTQAGHSSMQVTDRYVNLAAALLAGTAERTEGRLFGTGWAGNGQEPTGAERPYNEKGPA